MATYTQGDLDSIKEALLTGAVEVQIGDRKIKYRSQKEILELKKMVENDLASQSSSVSPNVIKAKYSKGEC